MYEFFSDSCNVPEESRQELLAAVDENLFARLHEEFSSSYRISQFVNKGGSYIAPVSVKLPANSDGVSRTFQYCPVIQLLTTIARELAFNAPQPSTQSDLLHDIKDGSAYQNNSYFKENPEALGIMLYSDEVEICNPLGAAKGAHKLLNVYMTLAEIPKRERAKVDNWFLVLSGRSKDISGNRELFYKPLIEDLHMLEEGIPFGSTTLKAGIVAYLSDNLEAHTVSGLSCCFSSRDICRVCHLQVKKFGTFFTGTTTSIYIVGNVSAQIFMDIFYYTYFT